MLNKLLFTNILLFTACSTQLVKPEMYISTEQFKDEAGNICMASHKFKQQVQPVRQTTCRQDAQHFIVEAEAKFREYKADEHNYRLCRSRFADIRISDKCFREQQEKYYRRALAGYKAALN